MASSHRQPDAGELLTVQEIHRPPAPVLRFVDQVVGSEPSDIKFRFTEGVLTQFDAAAVHVIEENVDLLLGTRGAGALVRCVATWALARNLRRHKIALVRTITGSDAQFTAPGVIGRLAQRLLDDVTTTFVAFDETVRTPDAARTTIIPHAHYRDRFTGYPGATQVRGRVLCVCAGESTELVTALLGIVRVADTEGLTLRVVGDATPDMEAAICSHLIKSGASVAARLERLSDGALVQEIDSAELVVVPETETLAGSQLLFLSLSRDRPVLTPRTAAMERLADEVGPGWIATSEGPITAESVDAAFTSVRSSVRRPHPRLDGRDLATTRAFYAATVKRAVASLQNRETGASRGNASSSRRHR